MRLIIVAIAALVLLCEPGFAADSSVPWTGLPGFITRECKLKKAEAIRQSPSCLLVTRYTTPEGKFRVAAIQEDLDRITHVRNVAIAQYCNDHLDRSQNSFESCTRISEQLESVTCPSIDGAQAGLSKIVCEFKDKHELPYVVAISDFERAIRIANDLNSSHPEGPFRSETNSPELMPFYEALFQALELVDSIQSEDSQQGDSYQDNVKYYTDAILRTVEISNARPEATNLVVPDGLRQQKDLDPNRVFFSPEELTSKGIDLSTLDPSASGFWSRSETPISLFKTIGYNGDQGAVDPLLFDPESEISVTVKSARANETVPALLVTLGGAEYEMKFDAPLGRVQDQIGVSNPLAITLQDQSQVHTSVAVGNIATAIGFNTAHSYFKRSVRVYLPGDSFNLALSKILTDLARSTQQDDLMQWDYRNALSDIRTDEQGRKYIRLGGAAFTLKSDGNRVQAGSFVKNDDGRNLKREFRAFQLFYAWVADHDTKDRNARLFVEKPQAGADRPYRTVFSAEDLASTMGSVWQSDRPNLYDSSIVSLATPDRVVLTYKTRYHSSLFDAVTFADARWMVRLMAQLTHEQLYQAFIGAGEYPAVAELFAQKMMRRRDQLAQAVGLPELAHTSAMAAPADYRVPGYEALFNDQGQIVDCSSLDPRICQTGFTGATKRGTIRAYLNAALNFGVFNYGIANGLDRLTLGKGFNIEGVHNEVVLDSFLPERFSVENPDASAEFPYWTIDLYRLPGLDVGIEDGVDLGPLTPLGQVKAYKIYEFVRIHPTRSDELAPELAKVYKLYDPRTMAKEWKEAIRGMREDMISTMKPGDMLIASNYLAFGASITQTPASVFNSGIDSTLGAELVRFKRTLLTREDDSHVVGVWETMTKGSLQADLQLKMLLNDWPLLAAQVSKRTQKDRAYRFDLSDSTQNQALSDNLMRWLPELPEHLDVESLVDRSQKVTQSKFFASLLGFLNKLWAHKNAEVKNGDGKTLLTRSETNLTYGLEVGQPGHLGFKVESVGELGDSLLADLHIRDTQYHATRETFEKVYKKYLPAVFPRQGELLQFGPNDTSYYLGILDLDAEIEFKKGALEDILRPDRTRETVCEQLASTLPIAVKFDAAGKDSDFPRRWCELLKTGSFIGDYAGFLERIDFSDRTLIAHAIDDSLTFLDHFESAQRAYVAYARNTGGRKPLVNAMKKINTLIRQSVNSSAVAMTLASLTSDQNLVRSVTLKSSLSGFPGQERVIQLRTGGDSDLLPLRREFDDLFFDRYFRYLDQHHVFFDALSRKNTKRYSVDFDHLDFDEIR